MNKFLKLFIIVCVLICSILLIGCATVSNITSDDNKRFEEEFNRNNPIPRIPPPVLPRII